MKIKQLFFNLFARKIFQSSFEKLHFIALRGMNYGAANSPKDSGEEWLLKHISKQVKGGAIILDIGANVGQFAALAATLFSKDSAIYSFEPAKTTYSGLVKTVGDFTQVQTFNMGMGDMIDEIELFYDGEGSVLASAYQVNEKFKFSEKVKISTVDIFCKAHNIESIDLLKIDVEGFELNVIQGAKQFIDSKKVKFIQFEFGNRQINSHHFLNDFRKAMPGYQIFRLVQDGLRAVNNDARFEIFQISNFVAVLNS
jgi:FkbM family methyltransferase